MIGNWFICRDGLAGAADRFLLMFACYSVLVTFALFSLLDLESDLGLWFDGVYWVFIEFTFVVRMLIGLPPER